MRFVPLARLSREALDEARAFVRLDVAPSAEVLKGPALRERRRRIEWARHLVQAGFLLAVAVVGWEFARWVHGLEAGRIVGERPPGVEAFLPIAALLSLRHLVTSGEIHPVHPAGLAILLLVAGISLLAKKAFCSWVCPVGTLSEMLANLSQRLFRRKLGLPRLLDLPLRSLKYLLLAFFVYAVFFQMGPAAVADFLDSPYNRVADVKMLYFFERLSPFALKVLAGLVASSRSSSRTPGAATSAPTARSSARSPSSRRSRSRATLRPASTATSARRPAPRACRWRGSPA